ncbi:MAG: GNAT family N-acetyltransferase [Hyphomicrobiales bacterium]
MTDHGLAPVIAQSDYAAPAAAAGDAVATGEAVVDIASGLPAGYTLDVVTDLDGLIALKDEWERLETEAAAAHNFFQSFTWCSAWARAYLAASGDTWLKTIVGRRHGETVMIWPLMVVRHGPLCVLKWLSDPVAHYGDVLVERTDEARAWLEAAWEKLTRDPSIDGMSLRYVREDAAVHELLHAKCVALPNRDVARYLDLKAFESPKRYDEALSRNQRSQRAKLRKKLERQGELGFRVASGGDGFDNAVHLALAFKKSWLDEHGLAGGVVDDPRFEQVFMDVAQGLDAQATSVAGLLTLDGWPIAVDLSFRFKDHYFGFVLAEDGAARTHSPAKVLLDMRQKWCVEERYGQFDMMAPDDPFKQHWSNQAVSVDHFVVSTNLWGTPYCTLYLRGLRPVLKRLYRNMPPAIRRKAVRFLSRLRRLVRPVA